MAYTETFADVENFLTTSVFVGLSKDSGFMHLIHTIQSQRTTQQYSLKMLYTLELDLNPLPPDVTHFPPDIQQCDSCVFE